MIYAIKALGTEYIKFGKAKSPKDRLAILQTGCPVDLQILATADWPDAEERGLHAYLTAIGVSQRGEWFKQCPEVDTIIQTMLKGLDGWRDTIRSRAPTRLKAVVNG